MPVVSSVALALGNGAMATHFAWSAALLAYDSKLSITVICACATLATASAAANANASPVQRAGLDDGLQDRALAIPLLSRPSSPNRLRSYHRIGIKSKQI